MDEPKLPLPVARVLRDAPPARTHELWRGIERRRARRRGVERAPLMAALACLAAAAFFAVQPQEAPAHPPSALSLRGDVAMPASLSADARTFHAVDLSDGSRITMAAGAKLDVLIASHKHVELVLREGRARFDVRPRGPRSWRVQSSGVSVDVVGTSFVVERSLHSVRVSVLHGVVLVRAPGLPDGVQRLNAGEEARVPVNVHFDDAHSRASEPAVPAVASTAQRAAENALLPAPTTRPAHAAKLALALTAKTPQPSVESLWREVDNARLRHAPAEAVALLATLRERDITPDQRALAAFTAGKLALDELAQPAQAARDLASAVALGLPSPLDIDARTRLVEAYARSDNPDAACAVVRDLEARGAAREGKFARNCPKP